MTREEAIKLLEHISIAYTPTDAYGDYDDPQPYEEAIDMAIEALQAETIPLSVADKIGEERERLQEKVAELQEKNADRPHGEWIPVTERLPEIDETLSLCDQISDEVLGTDTYGNIRHVYLTNCGYLKPTFCTVEEGMSVDIVAWTPLLEPYEEVER